MYFYAAAASPLLRRKAGRRAVRTVMNHKGLVTFDRKCRKDSDAYLEKMEGIPGILLFMFPKP